MPPQFLTDLAGLRVSAEDVFAAASETAAQPIWVVDPDDVMRFANPAAITALGYESADELLGRHRHETIHYAHPDGTPYPAAECPMLLPGSTGRTVARDVDSFIRRDGSRLPVSYVSVPIEMPEGRGAVVVFADIEDRLQAEDVRRERAAVLGAREDSLRRISALVAGGASSADVFAAIAREVGGVVGLPLVVVWRYAPDGTTATVMGAWSQGLNPFQPGTRWPLDGPSILTAVLTTGRQARIDDVSEFPGTIADAARTTGLGVGAGAPVIVDGELWGAVSGNTVRAPLPDHLEDRLAAFTELVATAISNTESRSGLARLAEERAALRRMATLVAAGAAPEDVFAAVTEEVGQLPGVDVAYLARYEPDRAVTALAAWGRAGDVFPVGGRLALEGRNLSTLVLDTGRPARIDSSADASGPAGVGLESGSRSSVGSPIVVERRLWGIVLVASTLDEPLPADTEARLASFTELVATAIANAESRAGLGRLAEEQAALRRVATLVARGTRPEEVFASVANEVGRLLSVDVANVIRYESDDTVSLVASAGQRIPVGSRWPLRETTLAPIVLETARPARVDSYAEVVGRLAEDLREERIRSAVATPILVEGRVWGQMVTASSQAQPLPLDTEARLASFTELVAMAIANAEARTEVARLVDEQAALRRVATLVAEGAAPSEVFETVTREVGILSGADLARMERYESDDSVVGVASWSRGGHAPELAVGKRFSLEGASIAIMVREASRPVRVDSFVDAHGPIAQEAQALGIRSSVGCPIVVEGSLWGVIAASSTSATPFPPDTESQIAEFTELVATAIANTEARNEVAASRARIVAAADEERRRVVRDLHDGAQQRLVHTILMVAQARKALEPDQEPASGFMTEALTQAQAATEELRDLAHGLLPEVLTHGGLRAAVKALALRTPMPVDVVVSVDRLPPAVEATSYFFVAEALTNVAKHAHATAATVLARVEDGSIRIQVRDDGVGGARSDGSGLVGLADRLAVLNGQLRLESPFDGGTLIAADIPLSG